MKKLTQIQISVSFCLAVVMWSMNVYGQGVNTARPLGTTSSPYGYYEYLPQDYKQNSNAYPIIIFLHGMGEQGNGTTQLRDVIGQGPSREVEQGRDFPFIIVSPQSPVWWNSNDINTFVEFVKRKYRVNSNKVYMTGLSMGAMGTFDYASKYGSQLAAIVPIAGKANLNTICNYSNLPVWAFHGDADPTVSVKYSIDAVNAYNACSPIPNPKAKLTIYPGVGHNSWTRTYDGSAGHDIYKWMFQYTSGGSTTTTNKVPSASAGSDKSITLPTNSLTITGTASDSDGSIASTSWSKISGPGATVSGTTTLSLKLSNLLEGSYTFRLTVKDNAGATKSDDVVVTVNPAPVSTPTQTTGGTNGLNYKFYATNWSNSWQQLPNFSSLTPNKTGVVSNFSLAPATQSNYYGFVYEGKIQIDASGTYTFTTDSDDGSQLFINGSLIVDNDGAHAAVERSGAVYLAAGMHSIKLTYFEYGGGETLSVYYDGPGFSKKLIPDSKLFNGSSTTTTNKVPSASAGSDKSITLPTNSLTITGTASDSDGSIASTSWSKISGPGATMSGTTTLSLKLSNLLEGSYTFRLTVKDNAGATKSDDVAVTVNPAPVSTPTQTTGGTNGLNYKFYATNWSNSWQQLPNFSSLTPNKTGVVSNFSLAPATQSNYYGFVYEGKIQIDASGTYTFTTDSDDGSQLFINGSLIVDNDGAHAAVERSGAVYLAAGMHSIKLTYFEYGGGETLSVYYDGPGFSKKLIPDSKLFNGSSIVKTAPETDTTTDNEGYSISAPSNLQVSYNSTYNSVTLSWTDNSINDDGFEVFMSTGTTSNFSEIGSTGSGKTNYVKNGFSNGETYYFKVRAKGSSGFSNFSNTATLALDGAGSSRISATNLDDELMDTSSLELSASMSVYPNPAQDYAVVQFGSDVEGAVKVELLDMSGRVKLSQIVQSSESDNLRLELNSNSISQGLYIIRVSNGAQQRTFKLLKN